jgi:hypothetical protein
MEDLTIAIPIAKKRISIHTKSSSMQLLRKRPNARATVMVSRRRIPKRRKRKRLESISRARPWIFLSGLDEDLFEN